MSTNYNPKDIVVEAYPYWALRTAQGFTIYKAGITHSTRVASIGFTGEAGFEAGLKWVRAEISRLLKDGTRMKPAPRVDVSGAAKLAESFHGRAPEFEDTYEKPRIPDAMANIGAVYAIEYLAERDGKEYRFRHVFKQKSRPQLAVAPDGKFVTMIGGSWRFTEDGFEDT